MHRLCVLVASTAAFAALLAGTSPPPPLLLLRQQRVVHTDEEWRSLLSSGQYRILRRAGTELPNTRCAHVLTHIARCSRRRTRHRACSQPAETLLRPCLCSPLNKEKRRGTFVCAGCGSPLFSSEAKFNSGTGWPSFFEALDGARACAVHVLCMACALLQRVHLAPAMCMPPNSLTRAARSAGAVVETADNSIPFMPRTEIRCKSCGGHLGHSFDDAPMTPTGMRYCMNGLALKFEPADQAAAA